MTLRAAAFNTGPDFHLLDHIAPLAELMEIPLIVTDETNYQLALKYYPQVSIRFQPNLEFELRSITEEFDHLFECKFWSAHLRHLFLKIYNKQVDLIFCPHGMSDKGFKAPLLSPYALQDGVLIYGKLQIQMLKQLNVWNSISRFSLVGNYRLDFYEKYKTFYDKIAAEEIFSKLDSRKRILLYAPTWNDADRSTSFFSLGKDVLSNIPDDWNVIVKVHPLLEQRDPSDYYRIARRVNQKSNALLIHEFPPVYPILSKVDAYLGDLSSVGYDFLSYEKPLLFLPTEKRGRLHTCGLTTTPSSLPEILKNLIPMKEKQRALYHLSFGSNPSSVKENILRMCKGINYAIK